MPTTSLIAGYGQSPFHAQLKRHGFRPVRCTPTASRLVWKQIRWVYVNKNGDELVMHRIAWKPLRMLADGWRVNLLRKGEVVAQWLEPTAKHLREVLKTLQK